MLRKTLSLALALVMALSLSVTVFAANGTHDKDDIGVPVEIDGSGTTIYVSLEIYDVLLPTDNAFDFTLDPQGLTGIEDGGSASIDELTGGLVVGPTVAFINYSAVPINLTVSYVGITSAEGGATFAESAEKIHDNTVNSVYLTLTPSSTAVTAAAADADAGFLASTTTAFAVSSEEMVANFLLPAAEYEITEADGTYTAAIVADAVGGGNALKVGGVVNKSADWSAFEGESPAKTVGMETVFSFVKDTAEYDAEDDYVAGVYGLLTGEPAEVPLGFMNYDSGTATAAVYNISGLDTSGAIAIPFNFGESTTAVVKFVSGGTNMNTNDYTVNATAGTITFSPTRSNSIRGLAADTTYYVVVDSIEYTLTFKV